jgi:endonuclease/exonuclease/phosphatase (EEP) superfamily protein YafD
VISVRRILGALVALAAIPIALVSAAAFAGRIDWRLDLVANARVQLWWVSGAVLLLALPTRSRVAIGSAGLAVALNLGPIVPLHLPVRPPDQPATVQVLTFNLLSNNRRHSDVAAYIRSTGADVVFLHEGTEVWERALEGAGLDGYEIVTGRDPDLIFGTIALVPPGSTVRSFGFRLADMRAIEVVVDGVSILGVHPLAPVGPWEASTRDAQLATYAAWAAAVDGPKVVVGDFNATPWTVPFRHLLREGGLVNSQRGHGTSPTWEVDRWWRLPIDHLVHSSDLRVVGRVVGPDLGSDHRPLLVGLAPAG